MSITARIDALLANTPASEVEEFEVCRCLRDAKAEVERLRLTDAEREAVERAFEALLGVEDVSAGSCARDAAAAATLSGLLERLGGES